MIQEWSTQQLLDLLAPIEEKIDLKSKRGIRMMGGFWKSALKKSFDFVVPQLRERQRTKSSESVQAGYDLTYAQTAPEYLKRFDGLFKSNYFRINNQLLVRCSKSSAMHTLRRKAGDVIEQLHPQSVCEIGSGTGEAVMYLANRFPKINFTGYELTETGTKLAKSLQDSDLLGTTFAKFYELNAEGMKAVKRITFKQGSAYDLPAADKSFDIVYTQAAIEQMADNCPKALSEIRRITKQYVIFCEPFADVNDIVSRVYLRSGNYFRLSTKQLRKHGFEPVTLIKNLPVKVTFAYGMLVAKVIP